MNVAAEQFRTAARRSLANAVYWRDRARLRPTAHGRRVHRVVMRAYAHEWRQLTTAAVAA